MARELDSRPIEPIFILEWESKRGDIFLAIYGVQDLKRGPVR